MIRLFVAVELPKDLRRRMASLGVGVAGARWVAEENLHLTVRFIGEVGEDMLDDVASALAAVRRAPFSVTLSGAGHFGSRRAVSTLWLGVERSAALIDLRERVNSALAHAGLEPERRKFQPHVTLARLTRGSPGSVHHWLAANTLFRAMPFTVDRLVLFSSHLGRGGPIYTPEASYPFDG